MFFWGKRRRKEQSGWPKAKLGASLQANVAYFKQTLLKDDDHIMYREFKTAEPAARDCVLIYADNMTDRTYFTDFVLRPLMAASLGRLKGRKLIDHLIQNVLPVDDAGAQNEMAKLADSIIGGSVVLLVEGCDLAVVAEAMGWEKRGVTEPFSEAVVRGPRVGFTEDLHVGVALLRRRVNSPNFKVKVMKVGTQTRTEVAVVYLDGIVRPNLVEQVIKRIEDIEIDAILESGYIEELIRDSPNSPFPTIGRTERPDVVAGKILEGRVAVLVDGTPFALTMPYLFLESFQANEDYYKSWLGASFVRFLRYLGFFLTTSIPAIYLALITYHPHLIPTELVLSISASRKAVPFPAVVEVLAMGLVFEILREGGLRLPQPIGESVSIVGAIVLGEAAVTARLISAPMIIIVALTGIAGFLNPKLHDLAVQLRFIFVLLASVLGVYGYLFGLIGVTIHLAAVTSFGVPYLSSLTSFKAQDLKDTMFRAPWRAMFLRPRFLAPKDRKRLRRKGR